MSEDVRSRQIGLRHDDALSNLQKVIDLWALPFLRLWIDGGAQPIVSSEEQSSIQAKPGPASSWLRVVPRIRQSTRWSDAFQPAQFY